MGSFLHDKSRFQYVYYNTVKVHSIAWTIFLSPKFLTKMPKFQLAYISKAFYTYCNTLKLNGVYTNQKLCGSWFGHQTECNQYITILHDGLGNKYFANRISLGTSLLPHVSAADWYTYNMKAVAQKLRLASLNYKYDN